MRIWKEMEREGETEKEIWVEDGGNAFFIVIVASLISPRWSFG